MRLHVHVLGQLVAVLEQEGDFRSVLTYVYDAPTNLLVSLTMVVRTESYAWNDQLPPVFQMNLPEGYLLQVLQEEFGPHVGASPVALLSVIGRNMVGRLQVAPPGAQLDEAAKPIEVASLLQGDNSEEAFTQLVREHAVSGVSGVLPKFLDTEKEAAAPARTFGPHKKATLLTHRHIIKGSSPRIPFATVNEYLCMQVVGKIVRSAKTELSEDGNVLVVHRFDVGADGNPYWAMEDFCALLGLRPAAKYETTWERIARGVRELLPGDRQYETFQNLTAILLLTYALRNADCHSKNLALLYSSQDDAHLAPAYDFLTTSVYAGYQNNPPGISFMGKKTWLPGKNLAKFITATFGIPHREQIETVERISDSVADVAPLVLEMTRRFAAFKDTGKRMLSAWNEGVNQLRDTRIYAMPAWRSNRAFHGLSDPPKLAHPSAKVGRSPLLADRSKKRKTAK